MNHRWLAAPLIGLVIGAGSVAAQDQESQQETPPEPTLVEAPELNVSYTDDEIAEVARMLTGVWQSTEPVSEFGSDGNADILLSIAPATVNGLNDMLYAEMARADDPAVPYRQAFYQVYRFEGGLRLRTYDIRPPQLAVALQGMAFVPEHFPETVTAADMYPTMDIDLERTDHGFAGHSPCAYPDHRGGAVQMTSSIEITNDTLQISDVGYGADGKVAWGVGDSGGVAFERTDSAVGVERYSDGLVVLHFAEPGGRAIADNDWLVVHYTGKLTDGSKFDSSYDRGEPFRYQYPGKLIPGWMRGVEGMTKGSKRRFIIPPALAYGDQKVNRIPPGSTLIFDVECVYIEEAPTPTPEEDEPAEDAEEGSGNETGGE